MSQKKYIRQKLWKLLKTIYWKYISDIDDFWKYKTVGSPPLYLPSFFKIHSPEEAERIIREDQKFFDAELKALGEWEEAQKALEAKRQ